MGSKAANQMLALRSLANLFGSEKGIQLMTDLSDTIIKHFSAMFPLDNKQAQIAMSTVLLNYAVVYTSRKISHESLSSLHSGHDRIRGQVSQHGNARHPIVGRR